MDGHPRHTTRLSVASPTAHVDHLAGNDGSVARHHRDRMNRCVSCVAEANAGRCDLPAHPCWSDWPCGVAPRHPALHRSRHSRHSHRSHHDSDRRHFARFGSNAPSHQRTHHTCCHHMTCGDLSLAHHHTTRVSPFPSLHYPPVTRYGPTPAHATDARYARNARHARVVGKQLPAHKHHATCQAFQMDAERARVSSNDRYAHTHMSLSCAIVSPSTQIGNCMGKMGNDSHRHHPLPMYGKGQGDRSHLDDAWIHPAMLGGDDRLDLFNSRIELSLAIDDHIVVAIHLGHLTLGVEQA